MEGMEVVTFDDDKIGTALEHRDGFVIVESGHVFKSKHAIPEEFVHEQNGVMIATVAKDVVMDSPKLENGDVDAGAVRRHYGLEVPFEVEPDADEPRGAYDQRPTGEDDLALQGPVVRDRQPNANDPGGNTANMTDRNRTGGKS